ncbi:hypothetical protein ACFLEY_03915 [Bradyrhizobium sp. YCK136]|uniref:hypothetical protein n=1 Tax=Bradyrhizobium TaxID=374 RepID=UPI00076597C1|nr:hypothetical protein [Bradyrhizobium diazoefficiens]MBR0861697.1 hypothetical protein [Bradyrhizobium diazoefficiens]MBR0886182.1 hypothetical protein [Bradyrhizobium diazoefficiens]MBR0918005.1 hypothetical protein [Bradyrhizobium diazoefficiens]
MQVGTRVQVAAAHGVTKKRGRRQPQAEEFQVALDLPPSPPILERELRAIEVLLGRELQDLLTDNATDSNENSR